MTVSMSKPIASTQSMPLPYFGAFRHNLPDGFVAFPVVFHRGEQLVPGELLGVEDEVLDGGEAVDGRAFADRLEGAVVNPAREPFAVRVQVAALGHGQVVQHGRCGRGEVVRLHAHGDVLLDHRVLAEVFELRAERLPHFVEACPSARVAGLTRTECRGALSICRAERHLRDRAVVDAAAAR